MLVFYNLASRFLRISLIANGSLRLYGSLRLHGSLQFNGSLLTFGSLACRGSLTVHGSLKYDGSLRLHGSLLTHWLQFYVHDQVLQSDTEVAAFDYAAEYTLAHGSEPEIT